VTGSAAYFGRVGVQHGNDGVVHDLLAFDAIIIDDVAQAMFPHLSLQAL
jgi:hypothetical protein